MIIKAPIVTEESQIQTGKANQYTFKVSPSANKKQIAEAVEALKPGIKVTSVNTMNYTGKIRRQPGTRNVGKKRNWKKAIVTLRAGDTIDLI
jgi:large subunit ribosomal protein L23